MTGDLVAFLRARLDEDEQAAREAAGEVEESSWIGSQESGHPWRYQNQGVWGEHDGLCAEAPRVADTDRRAIQDHIARHDPDRVLAEVAAKRALVDDYAEVAELDTEDAEPEFAYGRAAGLGIAVRLIAAAYAAHPDYREAWRP